MNDRSNILITGATRGLGLCYARYLSKKGFNIALTDISDKACRVYNEANSVAEILDELQGNGIKAFFCECDLSDEKSAKDMVGNVESNFGPIYGLVANAGGDIVGDDILASGGKAEKNSFFINYNDFEAIYKRNFYTCLHTLRAVVPNMIARKNGKIVTVSSVVAGLGVNKETTYAVAKASIIHLTRCLASEVRPWDINVNCIAPGGTASGRFLSTIQDRSGHDVERMDCSGRLERVATPDDIAPVISFLLSPASDFISGQVIRVDGGQFISPI